MKTKFSKKHSKKVITEEKPVKIKVSKKSIKKVTPKKTKAILHFKKEPKWMSDLKVLEAEIEKKKETKVNLDKDK